MLADSPGRASSDSGAASSADSLVCARFGGSAYGFVVCSRWRLPGADGSTAAGASSRASFAISSTRHYCRRRKRLVLGPLGLGNARRWFAVRKAQGTKMALGAAANVQLTGF